jgi:hypothetical protein
MSDGQQPTAKRYRETAGEIRWVALRMRPREIRRQLLDLAEPLNRPGLHGCAWIAAFRAGEQRLAGL